MKLARNLSATVWLLGALLLLTGLLVWAQEPPPDLHMLLNLDLFAGPTANPDNPTPDQGPSLLDQIRTLAALGYLGKAPAPQEQANQPANEPVKDTPPPAGNPVVFPDYELLPGQGDQP